MMTSLFGPGGPLGVGPASSAGRRAAAAALSSGGGELEAALAGAAASSRMNDGDTEHGEDIAAPRAAPIDYSASWTCPGCLASNVGDAILCSVVPCVACGVRRRVIYMGDTIARPVFADAVAIFTAARRLAGVGAAAGSSSSSSSGRSKKASHSSAAALVTRIAALVEGREMASLEQSGWRVRDSIDLLLHASLKLPSSVAMKIYLPHGSDGNSAALLNVLVNLIRCVSRVPPAHVCACKCVCKCVYIVIHMYVQVHIV